MIIRRIEVRNFRKLAGPLVVDNLGPGLWIIEGENEEGKSTLLQCIRCAFFDKHSVTGQRAASFQPYSSAVRPEIRITFELNGRSYTLFKAFCQHPEAELTTPTGRLSGDAAEEELEKLLRFTHAKRARRDDADHEHEGVFGMFWVEQGKSFARLDPNEDGRSGIVQALQKEVGDVLGGKRGQRILAEVSKRRTELQTSTGKPRGEFAEASRNLLEIGDQLAKLNKAIAEQEHKAEELEGYRNKLERHERDGSVERAEKRLRGAREAQAKIERLEQALRDARNALITEQANQKLAVNRNEQRTNAVATVEAASRRIEQLRAEWEQKQEVVQQLRERLKPEEVTVTQLSTAFENADSGYRKAEAAQRLAQTDSDLARLQRDEQSALAAKAEQEAASVEAKAIAIEKTDLAELDRLEKGLTRSQAQLDAIATNVRIKLESDFTAEMDGVAIASGTERKITQPAVLQIAKCAEITITPGGDVGNPRAELERDTHRLRKALAKLGVESAADAKAKLERRLELLMRADSARQVLEAHAPDGLEALQDNIATAQSEKRRLLEVIGGAPISTGDAAAALEDARRLREKAERELKAASQRAQQTRGELSAGTVQEAVSKANYDTENRHLSEAEERVATARKEAADADVRQAVLDAAQAVKTATATAEVAEAALKEADPETVARELQISEKALEGVRDEIRKLENDVLRLETELRTLGASGLGEQKQELEGQHAAADATLKRLERQVKVTDLLYNALVQAEREAKETFLRPVTERVQPYLKLLLPGTELKLDEDMQIIGLVRDAVEEKFEDLSIGTREQLAVLTRLAFADLLREHGQPAAVLLDDAIVFSDDRRFDRMMHVLHKAAEHLQVIVLTCRERDYLAAGAPTIHLSDCLVSAPAKAAG